MRDFIHNSQFTEILVEGHQYAPLTVGMCQDFLVARVCGPFASPYNVMACRFEFLARPSLHAGIQKKLHAWASTKNGSIRSWPTSRRA